VERFAGRAGKASHRVAIVSLIAVGIALGFVASCGGGGGGGDDGAGRKNEAKGSSAACGVAASQVIALGAVASRASGVAPLFVFFDATGTVASTTTRPFHDLEYLWDFGDPGSGNWARGSRAGTSSRNAATGGVSGHIFESAGTYTVCATATDGTNTAAQEITVTVTDPDAVFPGINTICFSNGSSFAGCPAAALLVANSNNFGAVMSLAGPGKRLLLERGGVWSVTATARLSAAGPGTVGAYGVGAKPVVRAAVNSTMLLLSDKSTPTFGDWRLMDLDFDGQSGTSADLITSEGGANQITILRIDGHDGSGGISFSTGILDFWNANGHPGHAIYDQLAIVDSTIVHLTGNGGAGGFLGARRLAWIGNLVDDASGSHLLRAFYIDKGVISNGTFSKAGALRHALKIHGPCIAFQAAGCTLSPLLGANVTQRVVVSDNIFVGDAGVDWTVAFGPENSDSDQRVRDVVFERNWLKTVAGTQTALMMFATEITVRNNLCDATNGLAHECFHVGRRGIEPAPQNIRLYNNTCFSGSTGGFNCVGLEAAASNITVKNNLAYAPNATSPVLLNNAGAAGVTQTNNSSNASVKNTSPNFANPALSSPSHFALSAPSYAINAGAQVPVLGDFFLAPRPVGGAWDIGAAEQ